MANTDRTLMGLRLILQKFGIIIAQTLVVKPIESPDMDYISSCVSLLQLVHPMGYEFGIVDIEDRQRIRSLKLISDVQLLQKKISSGQLILIERKFKLNKRVEEKIIDLLRHGEAPEDSPFMGVQWLSFLGFYNILSKRCCCEEIIEILMKNYVDFLPYVDLAEEALSEIQFNNVRYV